MRSRRERGLCVVPSPNSPGLTTAERLALTLRRDATISGRCACGATMPRVRARRGEVVHAAMRHEPECPAADGPHIEALVRRLGNALQYDQVIIEFEVAA
jgi:hypothetical protein